MADFSSSPAELLREGLNLTRPTRASGCGQTSYELKTWVEYSLVPAIGVIIGFSFLHPRIRLWPKCCKMRPSVVSPVNLIDAYEDRWSFACAFAAMSTCVIFLFTGEWFYNPDISGLPSMFQGTLKIFISIVNVLEISIVYYPLLLFLSTDYEILGNTLGLVYTITWSFYYVATLASCPREKGLESVIVWAVLTPVFVCYLFLFLRFGLRLIQALRKIFWSQKESSVSMATLGGERDEGFTKTHYYERVKYLFAQAKPESEVSFTVRLRRKMIKDAPGFKFSRRSICTFVLSALTTYQLGLIYVMSFSGVWQETHHTLAIGGDIYNIFAKINRTDIFNEIQTFFDIAEGTFWPTCYFAIATSIVYCLHMVICYRKHTLQLWRGHKQFCPTEKASFSSLVVANLRFSGYHIGFSVWGFFILQILSWVVVFLVVYLVIYPLAASTETYVLDFLNDYWLTAVVGFALYYVQVILSQLAFLQSQKHETKTETYFGLDNRRFYNVTVYITLFMNVILGLASCLMRILKAVLFGVLFIGRIDHSTLMRGWELWDPGFKAYIGFLQLEVAHTHPAVVTFCHLLWQSIDRNKSAQLTSYKTFKVVEEAQEDAGISQPHVSKVKSRRARNRWFLALTLVHNRTLCVNRVLPISEIQQVRKESKDKTDNSAGKVSPVEVPTTVVKSETEL